MTVERNRRLNTPKTEQINELFASAIGLANVSDAWRWKRMSSTKAKDKLDKYVALRGAIAHRGGAASGVKKAQVQDYFKHIKRLVGKTGGRINSHVKDATGKSLW